MIEVVKRGVVAAPSTLLVDYAINATWAPCIIIAGAYVAARMLPRAADRHRLWVGALMLAVGLPVVAALVSLGGHIFGPWARPSSSVNSLSTVSWYGRGGLGPLVASPGTIRGIAAAYLALIAWRCVVLWMAWRSTAALRRLAYSAERGVLTDTARTGGRNLGIGPVPVRCFDEIATPMTIGVREPVLLVPSWVAGLSRTEITCIVWHELAHIRRRDVLTNFLCEVAAIPIAFHPATAAIRHFIRESADEACDAVAAAGVADSATYARTLVRIASIVSAGPVQDDMVLEAGFSDDRLIDRRVRAVLTSADQDRVGPFALGARQTVALLTLLAPCVAAASFSMGVALRSVGIASQWPVGRWEARLDGKPFFELSLRRTGDSLVGSASRSRFLATSDGRLLSAWIGTGEDSVTHATVTGDVLHFTTAGRVTSSAFGTRDSARYEMTRTNSSLAKLRTVDPDSQVPHLVAWQLARVASHD